MSVYDRIAERIREIAEETSSRVERYQVRSAAPLRLEQVDGDEVLEEGDEDFEIGENVRGFALESGHHVNVIRGPDGWHAVDVVATEDNPGP